MTPSSHASRSAAVRGLACGAGDCEKAGNAKPRHATAAATSVLIFMFPPSMPEAIRGERLDPEAVRRDVIGRAFAACERRREPPERGRRLDPVSALPHQPEESG